MIISDLNNGLSERNPFTDPKSSDYFVRLIFFFYINYFKFENLSNQMFQLFSNIYPSIHLSTYYRIYGEPNTATYRIANAQIIAHIAFMHVFSILQQRWKFSVKKLKGIRFQEDPEWQPDDRVVLFQHFFKGL